MKTKKLNLINTNIWLGENKNCFAPPVCNKLMHNEQLIVMFVGGPNQREDYHIEEGEELFYQVKGDMCVKIIENGQHKDIIIKEGEMFLLPARIPHSPQRKADTIGLVIERRRSVNEFDAVRWYVPKSVDTLYEKWFNCKDLGTELVPLIKDYFSSEEYATKVPGSNVLNKSEYPFELNNTLIDNNKHGAFNLLERCFSSDLSVLDFHSKELNLQFECTVFKRGEHILANFVGGSIDVWFWQLDGKSSISLANQDETDCFDLDRHDSLMVPVDYLCKEIKIKIESNESILLKVSQNPKFKFKMH
jgi:3-hydroxyanthranilate 3,4-dioxygenase